MNEESVGALSSILDLTCTRHSVRCQSRKQALETISILAAPDLYLPYQRIFDSILARERMGSTTIGNGVAIPHARLRSDRLRPVGVFIHLEQPVDFEASDKQPVDLLFALLIPDNQDERGIEPSLSQSAPCETCALKILSFVVERLSDKSLCKRLRASQSDEELYNEILGTT